MPSLVPQKALELPAMPDVADVFKNPVYAATRDRVISWLLPIYEKYSDIPVEKAWSKTQISEEFFLPMPTVTAFCSEVALCEAIIAHASAQMSDLVMQQVLKEFLDAHTWIYHPDGPRTNKKGRWPDWTRGAALYHLRFKKMLSGLENKQELSEKCVTVNAIQAWLLRLLEEKLGSTDFSLRQI